MENLLRVQSLTSIPGFAFMHGEDWGYAIVAMTQMHPNVDQNSDKFAALAKAHFDKARLAYTRPEFYRHYGQSTQNAERICCQLPSSNKAFHALLQSMVIQAWGAFEVMAEDLWKRAIKQRPKLDNRTKNERRLSGHRSREKIAKLYEYTFRVDNIAILRLLRNRHLHSLAIVRNVLVHSGGAIDDWFVKDRRGMTPLKCIRGKALGYKIPFTGKMVRHLIDPVTPLGFNLVRAVDKWLVDHK